MPRTRREQAPAAAPSMGGPSDLLALVDQLATEKARRIDAEREAAALRDEIKRLRAGHDGRGYLKIEEVAARFRVDESTIYTWMKRDLPFFQENGTGGRKSIRRVGLHHLREFEARHEIREGKPA